MIKVMLVAGRDTKKLANFLSSRGTYEIERSYTSLFAEEEQILNSIIHVNKLVYVYRDAAQPLRKDMQLLIQLLGADNFFRADGVIFIASEAKEADQAVAFFNTAMESCKYKDFSVTRMPALTFSDIYNATLGTSASSQEASIFKTVYLTGRNSDATVSYGEKDTSKWVVEAFNYRNLERYEQAKNIIQSVDTSSYSDSDRQDLGILSEPDFGSIDTRGTNKAAETFIFTGDGKTGKTTWVLETAVSARACGLRVLVLDFTKKREMQMVCADNEIACMCASFSDALRDASSLAGVFTILSPSGEAEYSVVPEMLQWLFTHPIQTDLILIALEPMLLESIVGIVDRTAAKLFFLVHPRQGDVTAISTALTAWQRQLPTALVLNHCITLMGGESFLTDATVKRMVPEGIRVVGNITFPDYRMDGALYTALQGVN